MESTEETRIITGVYDIKEATFQKVWEIKNFDIIWKDDKLLNDQTISIETIPYPNTSCNWMIGFERTYSQGENFWDQFVHVRMYCQLIRTNGEIGPEIHAKFKPQLKVNQADWESLSNHGSGKVTPNGKLQTNDIICFIIESNIQSNGSAFFNIRLKMMRQAATKICQKNNQEKLANLCLGFQTTLIDNLGKLLLDEDTSDVKIIASDDVELHGHKPILKMQNAVFASMLQSDFREGNTGIVKVADINGQTMRIILRFLYTGELLPEWSDAETILEFMYAAGKYQLTEVLEMLDETLGSESCEKYRSCYIPLLSLAGKLSLRKAEKNLLKEIGELTVKLESAEDFFSLVVDEANAVRKTGSGE